MESDWDYATFQSISGRLVFEGGLLPWPAGLPAAGLREVVAMLASDGWELDPVQPNEWDRIKLRRPI
jgi:hypothetical protein